MSGIRIRGVSRNTRRLSVTVNIPVATPSKTWVYVRLLAGIAGSIPARGMDVCLL
jgi:hypothetical protein